MNIYCGTLINPEDHQGKICKWKKLIGKVRKRDDKKIEKHILPKFKLNNRIKLFSCKNK
jgi:hypothetical protein